MRLSLELPTMKYAKRIEEYKDELIESNSTWEGTCCLRTCSTKEFIKNCAEWHRGKNISEACVPITEYLAVRYTDDRIVGMLNLRHSITPKFINTYSGHIGYQVRPTERKKGYCVEMLHLALQECVKMGLDKVLITCVTDNTASKKCILANGGVYERTIPLPQITNKSLFVERYWVNTASLPNTQYSVEEMPLPMHY